MGTSKPMHREQRLWSGYGGNGPNHCVTVVSAWGSRGANRPSRIGGNRVSVSIFLSKRHRATSALSPRLKSISFLLYSTLVVYLYYSNCSRLTLAIPFLVKFNLPQGTCLYLTSSIHHGQRRCARAKPPIGSRYVFPSCKCFHSDELQSLLQHSSFGR